MNVCTHRAARWGGVLLLAGGGLLLLLGGLAWGLEGLAPVFGDDVRALRAVPAAQMAQAQGVSVGNSHGQALDFGGLGVAGAVRWLGGSDPLEGALIGQAHLAAMPQLRWLFLPLTPLEPLDDNGSNGQTIRRLRAYAVAGAVDPWLWIAGDWRQWLRRPLTPLARPDHGEDPLRVLLDLPLFPPSAPPWHADWNDPHAGDAHVALHLKMVRASTLSAEERQRRFESGMARLVAACRARGVQVVFYTPPLHTAYRNSLARMAPQEAALGQGLIAAAGHLPGALYLDGATLFDRPAHDALFDNLDHLNPKGAARFSVWLRERLKEQGVW